ncbi:hypothetical protein FRB90_005315 [Tulasnella sp. 427]|nr:hypothetical protein FRB90_005315 [Tulasnella sp. 427]
MPSNMSLRWEDDARTVLLKLIVASFSTTAISGLSNEMPGLKLNTSQAGDVGEAEDEDGECVAILPDGRVLVSNYAHHHGDYNSSGLGREIKKIKAQEPEMSDALFGGWLERGRWRLIAKLFKSMWRLVKISVYLTARRTGLGWLLSFLMKGFVATTGRGASWVESAPTTVPTATLQTDSNQDSEQDDTDVDYNRFLRGVSVTSEGDGDYHPPTDDEDDEDAEEGWNFSDDEGDATETEDNHEVESSLALIEPASDAIPELHPVYQWSSLAVKPLPGRPTA